MSRRSVCHACAVGFAPGLDGVDGAGLNAWLDRPVTLARSGRFGVLDWRSIDDRVVWDDAMSAVLGAQPRESETLDTWLAAFLPQDSQAFSAALARVAADGVSTEVAFRVRRPDGSEVLIDAVLVPVPDDSGRVTRVLGVTVDVGAEQRAVAGRRASEERFRVLFEESPDAYLVVQEGRFVDCNKAAERLLRADRASVIGKRPADLSPVRQSDGRLSETAADEAIAQALQAGAATFDWVHLRADGIPVTVEVSAAAIDFDGQPALFVAWRDLTERRKAEAALRAAEQKYRFITENVGDLVWTLDPLDLKFTSCSPSVEKMLGYTPEEIMAQRLDSGLGHEEAAGICSMMASRIKQLEESEEIPPQVEVEELEQNHKDGSKVWTEVATVIRWNETTSRPEILGVTRDIRARKAAEAELTRLSMRDPMTGLLNQRGFHELAGQRLSQTPDGFAAVVFFDLDRLKQINDHAGHAAGNRALSSFAEALTDSFRQTDVIGRLGGDEFAVLLTASRPAPDEMVLGRLSSMLDDMNDDGGPRLGCSAGIAWHDLAGGPADLDELLRIADERMYRAKRAKRSTDTETENAAGARSGGR